MKPNVFIGILMVFLYVGLYADVKPGPDFTLGRMITMKLTDYRQYLQTHPPLDRLWILGDTAYFLISPTVIKIEGDGPFKHKPRQPGSSFNGAFHDYLETGELLQDLESRYPQWAKRLSIGQSTEGREIYALRIGNPVNSETSTQPNFYLLGGHHAREWISVELPLRFAQYLLENFSTDTTLQKLLNGCQLYIIPLQNPDGLEFSLHYYRMWRKNRHFLGNFTWGVDTNRNYGYQWGYDNQGSSPAPASADYRGEAAFSEPECQAIRDFMLAHPPAATISYHNFAQMILYPWGYTEDPIPHQAQYNELASQMSQRIYAVSNRTYTYGQSGATIYLTNGDLTDWIYGTFATPAFTIELPPLTFLYGGFYTPETQIEPTFRENLPALLYFFNSFISIQSPD